MIEQPGIEGNTILQLVFVLSVEGAEKQIAVQIDPALAGKPMELFGEARNEVDRLVAQGYTLTWYKDRGHSVKLEKLSDLTVTGEMNQRIFGVAAPFVPEATDAPEATAEPELPENDVETSSWMELGSADGLSYLLESVKENDYAGIGVKLTTDIDIKGGSVAFDLSRQSGPLTFDMGGHSIKNVNPLSVTGGTLAFSNVRFEKVTISGGTFTCGSEQDEYNLLQAADSNKVVVKKNSVIAVGDSMEEAIAALGGVKEGDTLTVEKVPAGANELNGIPEGVSVENQTGEELTVNGELVNNTETYTVPSYVAEVVGDKKYESLGDALRAVADSGTSGTVKLLKDASLDGDVDISNKALTFAIAGTEPITIDARGRTISSCTPLTVTGGTLNLKDANFVNVVVSGGDFSINGGGFNNATINGGSFELKNVKFEGDVKIKSGTFNCTGNVTFDGDYGSVIDGGTFTFGENTRCNLKINAGDFTVDGENFEFALDSIVSGTFRGKGVTLSTVEEYVAPGSMAEKIGNAIVVRRGTIGTTNDDYNISFTFDLLYDDPSFYLESCIGQTVALSLKVENGDRKINHIGFYPTDGYGDYDEFGSFSDGEGYIAYFGAIEANGSAAKQNPGDVCLYLFTREDYERNYIIIEGTAKVKFEGDSTVYEIPYCQRVYFKGGPAPAPTTYTVKFDAGKANSKVTAGTMPDPNPATATEGEPFKIPSDKPTWLDSDGEPAGVFAGWKIKNGDGTIYQPGGDIPTDVIKNDITLVAQWARLTVGNITIASEDSTYDVNAVVTYTFTLENSGDVDVKDITVKTDTTDLSSNYKDVTDIKINGAAGNSIASLAVNDDPVTITGTYTVKPEDIGSGKIWVKFIAEGTAGTDTVKIDGKKQFTPAGASAALTVDLTADKDNVAVGETVNYTVTVTNSGNVGLTGVTVTLAEGMKLVGSDYSQAGQVVNVGTIDWKGSATFQVTYTVTAADATGDSLVKSVSASYDDGGTVAAEATVTFRKVTVSYNMGSCLGEDYAGEPTTGKTFVEGLGYDVKEAPVWEGYTFDGWKDGSGKTYTAGEMITSVNSNITLTAQWRKNITITITPTVKSLPYNGTEQSVDAYTASELPAGKDLRVAYDGAENPQLTATNVGDSGSNSLTLTEGNFKLGGTDKDKYHAEFIIGGDGKASLTITPLGITATVNVANPAVWQSAGNYTLEASSVALANVVSDDEVTATLKEDKSVSVADQEDNVPFSTLFALTGDDFTLDGAKAKNYTIETVQFEPGSFFLPELCANGWTCCKICNRSKLFQLLPFPLAGTTVGDGLVLRFWMAER